MDERRRTDDALDDVCSPRDGRGDNHPQSLTISGDGESSHSAHGWTSGRAVAKLGPPTGERGCTDDASDDVCSPRVWVWPHSVIISARLARDELCVDFGALNARGSLVRPLRPAGTG